MFSNVPRQGKTCPRQAQNWPKPAQEMLNTGPRQVKDSPRQAQDSPRWAQDSFETCPRQDKHRPRQPKTRPGGTTIGYDRPRQPRDMATTGARQLNMAQKSRDKSKHAQANSRLAQDSPKQFKAALDWSKTGPTQAKTAHGLHRTSADMSWAGPSHAYIRPRQTCGRPKTDRRQAQDNACHS